MAKKKPGRPPKEAAPKKKRGRPPKKKPAPAELVPDTKQAEMEAQALEAVWRERCASDFMLFANGLTIAGAQGPVLFEDVMAPFQVDFFRDLEPCLVALKNKEMPPHRRFWLERTKKSSKDSDIAVAIVWLIAFCEQPLLVQICAASSEQASIIENRARALLHYNPWLEDHVEIITREVRSKRLPNTVVCKIEATGSAGAAQGPTPDLLVLNELVHVEKWGVMETHMNNADGVPQGVVIISTNAGVKGTPAHKWREAFLQSPRWKFHVWNRLSPWLNPEDAEESRQRDPIGSEHARLWEGKWVSGTGDAVGEDVLNDAFRIPGPTMRPEPAWSYVMGLDLGVSHDHAGVAVVGVCIPKQLVKICLIRGWAPSVPNNTGKLEVDLPDVELKAVQWAKRFRALDVGYDPAAGGSFMAQRMRKQGIRCREQTFRQAGLTEMALSFVSLLKARLMACYEDEEGRLRRDFGKFSIKHTPPSSYKLEAISDASGHADVGTAVLICLPRIVQLLGGQNGLLPTDILALDSDMDGLTEDELASLPDEFQQLFDMYDELGRGQVKKGPWDNFEY